MKPTRAQVLSELLLAALAMPQVRRFEVTFDDQGNLHATIVTTINAAVVPTVPVVAEG